MQLKLSLLGPPQVLVGPDPLHVDTRKATALLMYLVLTGEVQRRESMATLFWPESDGPHAKAALRRTLSTLRKALDGDWLQVDREVVSARADWLDCTIFSELIEATRGHDHPSDQGCPRCIEPLTEAAALYRGDFLEGFSLPDSPEFDDWQYFHYLAYQRLMGEGLQRLASAHQAQGEFEVGAEVANQLLALDPLNEAAHRMLMSIYASSGNRQLALRQYQDCVRVLQEELGAPPLDETVALNERIVAGALEQVAQPAHAAAPSTAAETTELPLVDRQPELAEMQEWYAGAQNRPRLLIIEGEQGIGKSRLANEFARNLAEQGARVLQARCYPDETTYAYRPWVDALRAGLRLPQAEQRLERIPDPWLEEVGRLLPELGELVPGAQVGNLGASSSGQDRFLEALTQVTEGLLAGPRPGVVVLDDLHWADEASLDFLTYLLRHAGESPMLVLAGWRTEGLLGEQQLRSVLARFPRQRTDLIRPGRLTAEQVGRLLRETGLEGAVAADQLYAETEGLPFFVAEYLGAIQRHGELPPEQMPRSVRQAIDGQLGALSGTGKQLLTTAAVIGRSFEYETLRMVSGRSQEETVSGIEELVGAGAIREFPSNSPQLGPAYDFTHDKLREVALEATTQARQRLLHGRAAEALARLQGHRESQLLAARIADHRLRSGDESGAAASYLQAAEHARSVYANEEALSHYRSALALGHPAQDQLHAAIGDLLTLTGLYAEAVQNYEAAAALQSEAPTAGIEHKLGRVYERWGRWEQAQHHFAAAEQAASQAERARVRADWSLLAHRQGQAQQAERLIEQALEDAQVADDPSALAQCHNILGILARARADAASARRHLERSLEYADQLSDPGARSAALNNLALALAQDGELQAALQAGEEALEICRELGDRHRAAALHSNLADLLHQAGEESAAKQHLTRSAELFAAVGVENGQYEPEIWKLVEW